jgi:hypothetical protein
MNEAKLIFGIREPKPARNFPPGRVRWLMRNDGFVKAAVRTPEGVRIFVVRDMGDAWEPMPNCEQASKTRADYGPADLSPAGMVTLPVADFLEMAREMDGLRRRLAVSKRNASLWLKQRNEARAEVERLSKPMMVEVTDLLGILGEMQQYIECCEVGHDGEYGSCRSFDELLSDGEVPVLYHKVLRLLESNSAESATEGGEG